jgi:threonine/homoserine/homoserine lactone efflux protein
MTTTDGNSTTSAARDDDLMDLWRSTAPVTDVDAVIDAVHRDLRTQKRYLLASYWFGAVVLVYIGWLDWNGVFVVPGVMTASVGLAFLFTGWRARRARLRCPEIARLSTVEQLRLALRHARAALLNARVCHTGLPLSVLAGMAAGPFITAEGSESGEPFWLAALWVAVTLSFVCGFVIFGLRLAHRKKVEIAELKRRLSEFDESM